MAQGGNILLETRSAVLSTVADGAVSELSRGRLQVVIANLPAANGQQDQYLVVDVAGVEMAIASDMQVITQGSAYLWPAKHLAPSSPNKGKQPATSASANGFVKLDFQSESVDERETFESILSSWTTFQDPSLTDHGHSRLVLMDEESGDIVGDLAMPFNEDKDLQQQIDARPGKEPVVVTFDGTTSPNGTPNVKISTLSEVTDKYGKSGSKLVGGAEFLSRGILMGAEKLGSGMNSVASSYTSRTQPTSSPLVFSPTVKSGINKVNGFSSTAFEFTSKTLNAIVDVAGSVGTKVGGIGTNSTNKDGTQKPPGSVKKFLGQSFTAVNTVLESLEVGSKHILSSGGDASTAVVGHAFGPDAADASRKMTGSVRHVLMVYIDARGVARKALVKGFGKSAVTAQFSGPGGPQQVVLQPDMDGKEGMNASTALPLGAPMQHQIRPQQQQQQQQQPGPPSYQPIRGGLSTGAAFGQAAFQSKR